METTNCKSVRSTLWDYAARTLPGPEAAVVGAHLSDCRECGLFSLEVGSLRNGLKQLPVRTPPALLSTRLLVIASRERSRWLIRRDPKTWAREILSRWKLHFDNLLRPFAVPATGGILTSCLCFGLIVNTLDIPRYAALYQDQDMPVALYSQVSIGDLTPFSYSGPDVKVELTVDAHGNVTDYDLLNAKVTPDQMRSIGNLVLYSTFTPATSFGQPVSSKRLFYIGHVNVSD